MIRNEIFQELEQRKQRRLYILLVVLILATLAALEFLGQLEQNPIKLKSEIEKTIQLKLSSKDLLVLESEAASGPPRWVNVELIGKGKQVTRIKMKSVRPYASNFEIELGGERYNLYRVGEVGTEMLEFFNSAHKWGLESNSPELLRLKINNVHIGIYMMEPELYEQLRDAQGQYYISLGSDIRLLKRILYHVETGKRKLLDKYFDTQKMAAYLVFFSLFSYDRPLDFNRLVFRFDPGSQKFVPFLTMGSIVMSLNEQGKWFKSHADFEGGSAYFERLNEANARALMDRAKEYRYRQLVEILMNEVLKQLNGKKTQKIKHDL